MNWSNWILPKARAWDERLRTRPFFEILLQGAGLSRSERVEALSYMVVRIAQFRLRQLTSTVAEIYGILMHQHLRRGCISTRGLQQILNDGNLTWYQATRWHATQRARRALGRVPLNGDCTQVYCGFRAEHRPGEPLPVFVLLDHTNKIIELVYAVDDAGDWIAITSGPGGKTTDSVARPALLRLAQWLDIDDPEGSVAAFF